MRFISNLRGTVWASFVALICLAAAAPGTWADDAPLRWKFKVGDKLKYQLSQKMTMVATAQQFGELKSTMDQQMDMLWDVQGVNEEGEAVIQQKFDRMRIKMTAPNMPGGGFEYDSKSEEAPTGIAALIAPLYKAMTEAEFEITMTARGEIKDVKIPEDIMATLQKTSGAGGLGGMATAEGFKKMISQGALVLPENAPKAGETWSTKIDMEIPAVGKQTVETTYKFEGTKDIDGKKFAVIRPELKMEIESKPAAPAEAPKEGEKDKEAQPKQVPPGLQMKIGEQSSSGEVLFNIDEGRLHSTKVGQKVTIDATVGPQTIQQKIDQEINVIVKPAGEDEETEAKTDTEVNADSDAKSDGEAESGADESKVKSEDAK